VEEASLLFPHTLLSHFRPHWRSQTRTHTYSHTHYRVSSHNKQCSYCFPAGGVTLRSIRADPNIIFVSKRELKPVLFGLIESNTSLFSPLVQILWAGVNTAIPFGCVPNNLTWMTLAHMWFCLHILGHFQKGQCESGPHQTNKNQHFIWSGPKQVN